MERSTLTIEEQETHINWSRGDDRVKIYVSDVTTMTRLDNLLSSCHNIHLPFCIPPWHISGEVF